MVQGKTNSSVGKLATGRRAMSEGQKAQRRQQILDAAWQMFQQRPYHDITMLAVADSLGLAKGTLYIYFQTKEELFLVILEQQLASWFAVVNAALTISGANSSVSTAAELLCGSLEERPNVVRMLALLYGIFEQNIEFAAALRFKQWLLTQLLSTGALLESCLGFLRPGDGARFLLRSHALIVGLQQMAEPSAPVREVLAQPGLEAFVVDFASEFRATITALLYGLEHQNVSL